MNKNIILLLLLSLFLSCSFINATSSQCRGPSTQQAANKRGVSTLNQSEMDELVESELLSLHSAEGLDVEDLEYLSHLTTEELNTLGFRRRFRRAFRRVGRALRRVARAIGRGIKAIGRVLGKVLRGLFRRRAKEIIANSVSSFNGYTGPTHSVLESRRPFIGGGSKATVVSVATASVLGRRRRRGFFRRLGRIARGAFRSPAAISRKIKRGLRGAARAIKKFGQRTARAINEQSLKRGGKIGRFFSAVSKKLSRQSMKRKMKALESKGQAAADGKPANCVACRVDCMKSYSTLGGSMFTSCTQQYYYYGCQAVSPCMKTSTSSDDEIEGMVGICAYRNGCKFTNQWKLVGENQIITDRLVGRIRGSGQDPE